MYVCVSEWIIIAYSDDLSPMRRQVISWTDVDLSHGNKLWWNSSQITHLFIQEHEVENVVCKTAVILYLSQMVIFTTRSKMYVMRCISDHLITYVVNCFEGNLLQIFLHFLSILAIEIAQTIQRIPHGRCGLLNYGWSVPWPSLPGIFRSWNKKD